MVVRQKEQADGDLSLIGIPSKCVLFDRYMSAFCHSILFEFHGLSMYRALNNSITTSPILNCIANLAFDTCMKASLVLSKYS